MSLPYSDTLLNVVMQRIIIGDSILPTLEVAYCSCEITMTLAHISFLIQVHIEESQLHNRPIVRRLTAKIVLVNGLPVERSDN